MPAPFYSLQRIVRRRLQFCPFRFHAKACASVATPVADPHPPSSGTNPGQLTPQGRKGLEKIVDSLFKERKLDRLVSRFKEASTIPRFRAKHRVYEVVVRRLAGAGRLDGVATILDAQKAYADDIVREGFAARLLSLYGHAGMAVAAEETFRQLPDLGGRCTVMSFNALLTACAEAGDFERVDKLFRSIPAENPEIVPNEVSFNIVIGSLCKRNDLDAAMCMLETMEKSRVEPGSITFHLLLTAFYKNGRFLDAEKVWAKMAEKNCNPDVKCYDARLRALVTVGRTVEAAELVAQLPSKGLKPDTSSFNSLIKGYCQDGNLEAARKVFEDLPAKDCFPNRETFETLVPVACGAGQLDLALAMCKESLNRKCYVAAKVLQSVVDGLAVESRVEDAKELVNLARLKLYSRKSLRMPSAPKAK